MQVTGDENVAGSDLREHIAKVIDHLDHVLPGQAPLLNFVHHNTLHGYQHLPFPAALAAAEERTGIYGYLAETEFRKIYAQGRIEDSDLHAAFEQVPSLAPDNKALSVDGTNIECREIARIAMVFGVEAISASQVAWQIDEQDALQRFQNDVPESARQKLLAASLPQNERQVIERLWEACLRVTANCASEQTNLSTTQTSAPAFAESEGYCPVDMEHHPQVQQAAGQLLRTLVTDVGQKSTLRGLLLTLTGQDILDGVRPYLIRFSAAQLDEGLATWQLPCRGEGLYPAWRQLAHHDAYFGLATMPGAAEILANLPEHAVDAIVASLRALRIPESQWDGYLERLALEIPGWSGLINWRQHRPGYKANQQSPARLMDFLAIRLILDRIWIEQLCRENWRIAGNFTAIHRHCADNLSELWVRHALFQRALPEHLAGRAQALMGLERDCSNREWHPAWRELADLCFAEIRPSGQENRAWQLFRLAQHLGLSAAQLSTMSTAAVGQIFSTLEKLTPALRGYLWLLAYEHHYRERLFTALTRNQGRGRWKRREIRPQAQLVFCMDDREESIRRHLEAINPALETLGAAGFFGVPMNWRGLNDQEITPLCPVVVTPSHEIREQPRPGAMASHTRQQRREQWRNFLQRLINQNLRRNLISSQLLLDLLAPGFLATLSGKVLWPRQMSALVGGIKRLIPDVSTQLQFTAAPDSPPASPAQPRLGFTDREQAERVSGFLRIIGITDQFAPLVVICGHGSASQNNPHLAAYDCGACSGRHGGPNARAFAAMANRPEIRALLAETQNIHIPPDTWFLGTEHNTCNEEILWFDLEDLPPSFQPSLDRLKADLKHGVLMSAHERCRRFASAPRHISPPQALRHVIKRANDFSQARPELGHATNAAAVIGRRSITQGAFFDRRVFLISYDPSQDPDGKIVESILLAAGPVGAGINLEYYFSTVNNDRYGCGTKVPHNVTGLFGVMEGASSDLRTGLPRQMIEIHEAMRLQVLVEADTAVLTAIYHRQPPLSELIGNGWLLLSAIHPNTGQLSVFVPGSGFVPWQDPGLPLAEVKSSTDWYAGHIEPLPPVLISNAAISTETSHAA